MNKKNENTKKNENRKKWKEQKWKQESLKIGNNILTIEKFVENSFF